jgi:energy-coupling factor transport system ATP-binding protein
MITFANVSLIYPNSQRTILDNLTFSVDEGELILVIGLTGAGKSSFMKLINGVIPHHTAGILSGEIIVDGKTTNLLKPGQLSGVIGIVGQNPLNGFVTSKVEDEIAFTLETNGYQPEVMRQRVEEVIDLLGLQNIRDRDLFTLSGGEQQRVAIASALVMNPKVLVLDEPTSALDPVAAEEVLAIVNKLVHDLGLTVIMAEHKLERVIQYVDRIVLVNGDGKVEIGSPQEIMSKSQINPPIVRVAKKLKLAKIPLSVRELKRLANDWQVQLPKIATPKSAANFANVNEIVISTEKLSVNYNERVILKSIDLKIATGEIVALMGRNGAGKSTLLKAISGQFDSYLGKLSVGGKDPAKLNGRDLVDLIGFVPQEPADLFYGSTVKQECAMADSDNQLPTDSTLKTLRSLSNQINENLHPRDLSEGQKLTLAISIVLATNPKILILDEPTRGLDYQAKDLLVGILRKLSRDGTTIIMATHDVELVAEFATRVLVLAEGELITDGSTLSVLTASPAFAPQMAKVFAKQNWLTVNDVISSEIDLKDNNA